jgi:hypothetical protein
MKNADRPAPGVVLTLAPAPDPDGVPVPVRVRRALKYLLRVCRLRCIRIEWVEKDERAAAPAKERPRGYRPRRSAE